MPSVPAQWLCWDTLGRWAPDIKLVVISTAFSVYHRFFGQTWQTHMCKQHIPLQGHWKSSVARCFTSCETNPFIWWPVNKLSAKKTMSYQDYHAEGCRELVLGFAQVGSHLVLVSLADHDHWTLRLQRIPRKGRFASRRIWHLTKLTELGGS